MTHKTKYFFITIVLLGLTFWAMLIYNIIINNRLTNKHWYETSIITKNDINKLYLICYHKNDPFKPSECDTIKILERVNGYIKYYNYTYKKIDSGSEWWVLDGATLLK